MNSFFLSGSIVTLTYIAILILIIIRRNSAYILRRSPTMLCTSLIGNLFQTLICMSQIFEIESEFHHNLNDNCFIFYRVRQSGNLFFHYLMFFPYVLRAYRLHFIFALDNKWNSQDFTFNKYIYRTKESWMILVLVLLMIPFIILIVIILNYCEFAQYLPASESNNHLDYSESSYLVICFIEQLAFILSIYSLKDVNDEYNMTQELTISMLVYFVTPIFAVFPISLGIYKPLPGILRNSFLVAFSFIFPLICSFKYKSPNDDITLEMLGSLELVLQSKLTLEYFEEFLKVFDELANDSRLEFSGYDALQLYMKCENFLYLSESADKNLLIDELLKSEIISINYSIENKETFGEIILNAKGQLFHFLNLEYFKRFKDSKQFLSLRKFIYRQEIYKGRLLTIGLDTSFYAGSDEKELGWSK